MSQDVAEADVDDLIFDEDYLPPSIDPRNTLTDSYSWFSDALLDQATSTAPDPAEEWILGVDEAGRGSVCGPQVYGVAFCPKSYEADLTEPGYDGALSLLVVS